MVESPVTHTADVDVKAASISGSGVGAFDSSVHNKKVPASISDRNPSEIDFSTLRETYTLTVVKG